MPQPVLERLSQIFSKRRVMKSKTLPLFLRPDLEDVVVHDAAYLEPNDYQQIFAIVPNLQRLVLSNACQLKDPAIDYMLERCSKLRHIQLYAANLVTNGICPQISPLEGSNKWSRHLVEVAAEETELDNIAKGQ